MTDSRPVLIVSTDRTRAEQLAEPLRNAGTTVTTETHGPAAAAALAAASVGVPGEGPGLLVLDLSLPELDLQRLREALGEASPPPEPLEAVERRQIAAMLRHTGGNRRKAAQLLGLARSTLLAKIRRYHLESTESEA
ncbi:MAG TPA: helix-turn-helix domain-containing protein [Gemmatimonadales bacterium]|nr:helix-turn-helix domain-containing protein [Gemmatimonadales bacterium]